VDAADDVRIGLLAVAHRWRLVHRAAATLLLAPEPLGGDPAP